MEEKDYCSDELMKKIWVLLVSDFRTTLGVDYAAEPLRILKEEGITGFRNYKFPTRCNVSVELFKREYQLENFFKRYRFERDAFSDAELLEMSIKKFIDTQERLDKGIHYSATTYAVLQKARHIAKDILGNYDLEEHRSLCRFGKRACVGTPYRDSYLDEKIKNLTGSHDHIRWFKNYLRTDDLLRSVIRDSSEKKRPFYKICDTLTMSHVPKSFKSLRGICPDTLLGSFYTSGLGKLIQSKLREHGLNIRKLQKRHGVLARKNSVSRNLVTADLSAASDSLTSELLRWVLPLPWYRAVMYGRIPFVELNGSRIRMNTVLTMGLGHTFPLQTLVFYCLLQAIKELVNVTGQISVYGDDLIYPRSIHKYVVKIFPNLQLILNVDKTYARDNFRESCGHDFYRGYNVRPFSLEAQHYHCSGLEYEKLLYRIHNGLTARWTKEEIPYTLEWITSELILSCNRILCVPPDFPDYSGVRVSEFTHGYFHESLTPCESFHSSWLVCLGEKTKRREVNSQGIYYWECLRNLQHPEPADIFDSITDLPILKFVKKKVKGKDVSDIVLVPTVAAKQSTVTYVTRFCTSTFTTLSHSGESTVQTGHRTEDRTGRPTRNPVCWARRVGWRGWPLT